MSDVKTAMGAAQFEGIAKVEALPATGMITIRGTFSDAGFGKAVCAAAGVEALPGVRETRLTGGKGLLWMSPDELLLICAYSAADRTAHQLAEALKGQHALVANVSDARSLFQVQGRNAREIIAKLAPVDMAPSAFGPGMVRRSRLAQVPAAIWMTDSSTVQIMCFRSVSEYVYGLLTTSAELGGEVGYY
ncbi:sarcosine oxidase subunit gamma [Pseudoprimorskyibacter insulae]|uniref:Sarcosine oxidase subunit gamma n=1 Tax=Pseudoprimorskyibacter insulae TaxID=1695997 RepID=A0A2R8AYE6_9RHOB|nr:sarcosine oxidase subunit gamma family protein [Pseudoprimorskyibacter insulae]SPF80899.1 Sarcosine oxidase subunit gamma [Pseudoprimorskyibacter insulae]